ncbi:unnamed protein product, partial [Laminaria digitata]
MVFVERRATAKVLCDYLSHCLTGRFMCGFVVGRSKNRGQQVVPGGAAPRQRKPEWRPLPDDIDQSDQGKRGK